MGVVVRRTVVGGRVVVVGSVNTDLVARARTLPRPGETVSGASFMVAGGGKGANAAVAAARQGAAVALVACLGDDDFGVARLADLAREGIDLAGVRRSSVASSGVALIVVDERGQNSIVVVPGTNGLVTPPMAEEVTLAPGDVMLTQLEVPLPTVEAALRRAHAARAVAVLNVAPYQPAVAELLPLVDVLIVNELEAADLLGAPPLTPERAPDAAAALRTRGAGAVAITLGGDGAVIAAADWHDRLPAPAVTVVDTTGAGDAFTGTLAAGLAAGLHLRDAAVRAIASGSLAVTRAGAQPSLPTRAEVDALLAAGGDH
ncbi:MAG: ribokinase [Thermomicrobiales bacterium]